MTASTKAVIRLVLDAWRERGWQDAGGAALAIASEVMGHGGYTDAVIRVVPPEFLDRNGTTREEVLGELRRVLGGVSGTTMDAAHRSAPRLKILFFASNPLDQVNLRVDEEAREIQSRLRQTEHRDLVDFASEWAVRPSDLIEAINRERPQVVHFSGHGSRQGELLFQDPDAKTKLVTREALAAMIKTFSGEVRLVVFNNCFSQAYAEDAAKFVEAAVGMNDSISDDAARTFAANFYAALGYGRSIQTAFDQARASLLLEQIPEERTPQLFVHPGVEASGLCLVPAASA